VRGEVEVPSFARTAKCGGLPIAGGPMTVQAPAAGCSRLRLTSAESRIELGFQGRKKDGPPKGAGPTIAAACPQMPAEPRGSGLEFLPVHEVQRQVEGRPFAAAAIGEIA